MRGQGGIDAARRGDAKALALLLEPFREYLNLMASRGIGPGLATKAGASDLVQETFLAAQKGIAGFRGSTQAEWRAWLEAILTNQLANLRRSYLDTQKRREGRKEGCGRSPSMDASIPQSITSASGQLQRQERDAAIEEALRRLPEHYRQVVLLASRRRADLRGDRGPDGDLGRGGTEAVGAGPDLPEDETWDRTMTPDDISPVDDALLADLLDADAALAEGRVPRLQGLSETHNTLGADGISGYLDVLRRLGHRGVSAPVRSHEETAPHRLGRFEIRDTLGQGGFGIVYLALDPTLGRQVALKVPRPEVLMTPEVRRRFLREARAAAGLDHPNIVAGPRGRRGGAALLHRLGLLPGAHALGLAQGADRAGAGPIPRRGWSRRSERRRPACPRSRHPPSRHQAEQRDPLRAGGRLAGGARSASESCLPRLTDFGLAKIAEETGEETRTGMPLGSPPYMAPEQAAGRNRDVGPATDVYALGATLYEILTGRPPFRGETATETLRLVLEADCVAPRVLRPGLPRDLETICLKCLMKDPSRRYATAGIARRRPASLSEPRADPRAADVARSADEQVGPSPPGPRRFRGPRGR